MHPSHPRPALARLFLDHPGAVNETYAQHMRVALGFSFWLFVASLAALIHALLPAAFEKTASRIIQRLHARMTRR